MDEGICAKTGVFLGAVVSSNFCLTFHETHISPGNGWLEDLLSFWDGLCSRAMLVFLDVLGSVTPFFYLAKFVVRPQDQNCERFSGFDGCDQSMCALVVFVGVFAFR